MSMKEHLTCDKCNQPILAPNGYFKIDVEHDICSNCLTYSDVIQAIRNDYLSQTGLRDIVLWLDRNKGE